MEPAGTDIHGFIIKEAMEYCKNHQEEEAVAVCRICHAPCCSECINLKTGICRSCVLKGVTILFAIMTIGAYTAWYSLL